MDAEPIVIYSHTIDPAGVAQLLRRLAPGCRVEGPDDNWSTVTITGPERLLRKPWTLSFGHNPDYYTGDDWPAQMNGMAGYFSRFPANENTDRIMRLIRSFRFALAVPWPEPDLFLDDAEDPRLPLLFAVVKHLDGVMFLPSSLRDASGRVLCDATGEPDRDAVMPAIRKDVPGGPRNQRTRSEGGTLPDDGDPPPPTAQRVARRALALAAVCGRALLEQEDLTDPGVEETRQRILAWVEAIGVGEELEPDEWKVLQSPPGKLLQQDALNATWRLEGLGVLAWALGRYDLPPYDELVNPGALLPSVAILDADAARALLASPTLRAPDELARLRDQHFALHWRLRNWQAKPRPMNFAEFARTAWFGPLDVSALRFAEDDLAIGDAPIARASADALGTAASATQERHLAANWLNGGSETYSRTDVST